MKMEMHGPTGRTGVSQLMYVGDDGVPASNPSASVPALMSLVVVGYVTGVSSGWTRIAGALTGLYLAKQIASGRVGV